MIIHILKFPFPPTANLIWRNSRRGGQTYLSPKYRDFLFDAQRDYSLQGRPRAPEDELFQVSINLHAPDFRRYDVDNRIKPVLDALTKIGYWKDDACVRKVTAAEGCPVTNGAAIVVVEPFEPVDDELSGEYYDLTPIQRKRRRKSA